MNKTELIAVVAEKTGVEKKTVEKTVRALLAEVTERVANKEKVQLAGFGTFEARARAARTGRNPHTGKEIKIAPVTAPTFKAGKTFKTAVAEKGK